VSSLTIIIINVFKHIDHYHVYIKIKDKI